MSRVAPTFIVLSGIIVLGAVVTLVGLLMLILGVGAATPTIFQVPTINVNVSTSSLPIIVMAAGLGVTVAALGLLVGHTRALNKARLELYQTSIAAGLSADDAKKAAREIFQNLR
jgi:hypothetical protein